MTAYDWLWELNIACCGFFSNEKPMQKASNGELRRWFKKGCVQINGRIVAVDDTVSMLHELILFPKNVHKRVSFKFTKEVL